MFLLSQLNILAFSTIPYGEKPPPSSANLERGVFKYDGKQAVTFRLEMRGWCGSPPTVCFHVNLKWRCAQYEYEMPVCQLLSAFPRTTKSNLCPTDPLLFTVTF